MKILSRRFDDYDEKWSGKVWVSSSEVSRFNARYPGSLLHSTRSYWFEFDYDGNLFDTDVPESDDCEAVDVMVEDCKYYFYKGTLPVWAVSSLSWRHGQ